MTDILARAAFLALLAGSTGAAAFVFHGVLADWGMSAPEWVLLVLYTTLMAWIGASFWICVFGAAELALGPRRRAAGELPDRTSCRPTDDATSRVAVVMPIYHEDAERAFDGLRATYDSLVDCGAIAAFEFFVLSDSRDPAACRAEEAAWLRLCRELAAGDRLFYRRRPENVGKKAGNVQEFCERWGRRYDYLLVLDADSVMGGETILEMVDRMEREPELGLLQAWPLRINGTTLFARCQQFAAAVHGRLIAAGLARLMGPQATYWGHNAMLRTEAFMQSCGLPRLPGRPPLGGEILSHDFVEAALLLRRGWRVRILADGDGSYEEGPPNLLDHAKRDRRWCQGNMQHGRLIAAEGFKTTSRLNFVLGIFSYCASAVWLAFLGAAVLAAAEPMPLAPDSLQAWIAILRDSSVPAGTPWLIGFTAVLLLGPKLLGTACMAAGALRRQQLARLPGLLASTLLEILLTALIAPTMMLLHAEFVVSVLAGRGVRWDPQSRDGSAVAWGDALRSLGPRCGLGAGLAGLACWWAPVLAWWMLPLLSGFLLTIPLVVWSSREDVGQWARRAGLFLSPAEVAPHPVVAQVTARRGRRGGHGGEADEGPLLAELRTLLGGGGGPAAAYQDSAQDMRSSARPGPSVRRRLEQVRSPSASGSS